MQNLLKLILALFFINGLVSCGHKKNPTGGKKDIIQPEIISLIPEEYSDITNSNIEIIFSKPIERNSILSGIYIYPPILLKKYIWDGNILTIKILEELEEKTNYYFTFSDGIKGEHGNTLNERSTFVFTSGKLNEQRISGDFIYEELEDKKYPVQLTILTADSTEVFSLEIPGNQYLIEDLNDVAHIIRAFIDKNINKKYDIEKEPYFQKLFEPQESLLLDISLTYADTVKPKQKSVEVINNNNIFIKFSEPISSYSEISIVTVDSMETSVDIIARYLYKDELSLITNQLDTLEYNIRVENILDMKNNLTNENSMQFYGTSIQDTIPPEVISSDPRNGSSVNSDLPKISVLFSEIIMEDDITTKIIEVETGNIENVTALNNNSKHYIFSPKHRLNNYSSYKFILTAKDINGNIMLNPLEIVFLPIMRKE